MGRYSLVIWWLAGTVAAIATGWVAALIHASGHAPLGLVSLAIGALLGAAISGLSATQHITCIRRLMIGTTVMAVLAVVSEHAWLYRDYCGQWREARATSAAVAMFRPKSPPSPGEYFARERNVPLWSLDAGIITATAIGLVVVLRRYWQ